MTSPKPKAKAKPKHTEPPSDSENANENENADTASDADADASGEDDDGDIDAEAEEMARRIGAQLWENMRAPDTNTHTTASPSPQPSQPNTSNKEATIISTIKKVLLFTEKDALVRSTFASISLGANDNVLDVLKKTVKEGTISKETASELSTGIISLARSEVLFGKAASSAGTAGAGGSAGVKRKRETDEEEETKSNITGNPVRKRPYIPNYLTIRLSEAVRAVQDALSSCPPFSPTACTTITTAPAGEVRPLDAALIASLQLPLHQIFLFSVTASVRGGKEMSILQEIGGLIQILSVLSGVPIGAPPTSDPTHTQALMDIETAIYPCLLPSCSKSFSRLYTLRSHQTRTHHLARPFHCLYCPARFARNHDLKRHSTTMHGQGGRRRGWKCGGCERVFSRRDAIRRHQNTRRQALLAQGGAATSGAGAGAGAGEKCVDGDVIEVEVGGDDEDTGGTTEREERSAKFWSEINDAEPLPGSFQKTSTGAAGENSGGSISGVVTVEDGELSNTMLKSIQTEIETLHPVLQAFALGALGAAAPTSSPNSSSFGSANQVGEGENTTGEGAGDGQLTLASVIARAQFLATSTSSSNPTNPPNTNPSSPSQQASTTPPPPSGGGTTTGIGTLSVYGLSDEQTKLLEHAIASAASAARAQAEAEAALFGDEGEGESEEEEEEGDEAEHDVEGRRGGGEAGEEGNDRVQSEGMDVSKE